MNTIKKVMCRFMKPTGPCQHGQVRPNVVQIGDRKVSFCTKHAGVIREMLNNGDPLPIVEQFVQGVINDGVLDPGSATPPQLSTAVKVAGRDGVAKSRTKKEKKRVEKYLQKLLPNVQEIVVRDGAFLPNDPSFCVGTGSRSLHYAKAARKRAKGLLGKRFKASHANLGNRMIAIAGGSTGYDHLHAKAALKESVQLWIVLPSKGYIDYYWNQVNKTDESEKMYKIVGKADVVIYVNESHIGRDGIKGHANLDRNKVMVHFARQNGGLYAYYSGSSGTRHTVDYARSVGVTKIWEIPTR